MGKYTEQSRRDFIQRTSCAALGAYAISSGLDQLGLISALAEQAAPTDYRALVCVFLNGGNDCNNTVIPTDATGYSLYSAARAASGLALPQGTLLPVTPPSIGLPFGLHPSLGGEFGAPGGGGAGYGLHGLWALQKAAIVSNAGPLIRPVTRAQYRAGLYRPYQLFSHSDQVTQWQTCSSTSPSQTGWGGRTSDRVLSANGGNLFPIVTSISGNSVFGIGMTTRQLTIGTGALNQVLVLSGFPATPTSQSTARRDSLDYLRTIDRQMILVATAGDATEQALQISQAFATNPTITTAFPNTGLGNQLLQVARIISLNQTSPQLSLNRQIFFVSIGGFDTHQNQLANHANLLTQVSQAMTSFYKATIEIGVADRVTQFWMSDFGRTLDPAGLGAGVVGSDHAWGSHLFVVGGSVLGGNFYGIPGTNGTVYPTLQKSGPDDTDGRGRWIPTASVDQYAATLATWFGLPSPDLSIVFPNIGQFSAANLGFMS